MEPVRAAQTWIVVMLVGCVATAFVAKLAHEAWPDLRAASGATFAAPGVALALVLVLLARRWLVGRAKDRVRRHLDPR